MNKTKRYTIMSNSHDSWFVENEKGDFCKYNIFDKACQNLCGVLYQLYTGYSEDDNNEYRTQYNYDAQAIWFLKEHGFVEIIEGEWPKTKYISFKFTEKFKK